MDESKIWIKIKVAPWQWPGINDIQHDINSSIHYRSHTIKPKCQTAGVNLDHAEKATTHIQTMKEEKQSEWTKKNSPL